jgi:hypothetical protein
MRNTHFKFLTFLLAIVYFKFLARSTINRGHTERYEIPKTSEP